MLLRVLGTAAGGGIPQWNCACPGCSGARAHPGRRRRHASLAVRAGEGRWYLVNATPDIGDQIEAHPDLHPGPGARQTPVAGVVLTDAELDHTLGLWRLREADRLEIVATAPVREAVEDRLRLGEVLTPYTTVTWRELDTRRTVALDSSGSGVRIDAVPVSGKRPRYAAGAPGHDAWVVALRLHDPDTGRTALYAPAVAAWPDALHRAAAEADCVIVDGTFWDDEEPRRTGISSRTATAMGHLPIDGPQGTARILATLPGRCLYTHLNNTNPLLDPAAPEHKELARLGLEVADDTLVIEL
ncbi:MULTISPECIES: pyrroloquinoline quinone biosynthesis protein PqqB [Streptomyces]|uniref:Coenzyme PQQ synthesis protein B n=1 Tax=Streptomyces thermoviolaceus subsp. thermoviolaceus TaxID=66860 RepID=A0ABX0YNA7_STRTL|nr:pyrroloquinoline quinone biosynthesis protein PqqB [Streptomyces thermoviolaceus]MCM3262598.1 pyrroloquinoline quinone biosynthesis protein PqqB [Streptomyces thermoviolaceus]NJP13982.1 pyrroloquinoline quinone biosynthesis protein PqqB [Streptomyces thermoviolaceus subsp. thermoviolaceus]WTD50337.1 pyrroloquinoline quinone biosynthesis protein PqqB [Streptomyces thermoviolaceus]GHA90074.1 coenzyme PQQ synthesis protein B [Streptomyces thermoviolaceus subsp. thermoviolaceus]